MAFTYAVECPDYAITVLVKAYLDFIFTRLVVDSNRTAGLGRRHIYHLCTVRLKCRDGTAAVFCRPQHH